MARGGKRRHHYFMRRSTDTEQRSQQPPSKKAKSNAKHVPVDFAFASAVRDDGDDAEVVQHGGCIYDAHLHQAFLASRQHATWLLQLVATATGYFVWQRRTCWHGDDASSKDVTTTELSPHMERLAAAITMFTDAFEEKTGVPWADRYDNVLRMKPLYLTNEPNDRFCFVAMEYPPASAAPLHERCPTSMHTDVRKLMSLFYKDDDDEGSVDDDEIMAMPLPLPYATVAIDYAHEILDHVAAAVLSRGRGRRAKLQAWSNLFFSAIPHTFPPRDMLDSMAKVENCRETLKELHMTSPTRSLVHHLPTVDHLELKYAALGVHLDVVPVESLEYDLVSTYLHNSKSHVQYKMEIKTVYRVMKTARPHALTHEATAFKPYEEFGNRKLLWHGSTMANWPGILKDGLQIAPPHVASNGHSFGKGIYFSDSVSRSAPYCRATVDKRTGILLLSEVALGNPNVCTITNSRAQSEVDFVEYHSVLAVGSYAPSPDNHHVLPDGAVIPIGALKRNSVDGKRTTHMNLGTGLDYNEYVIYNPAQTRMRFLVVADFNFEL